MYAFFLDIDGTIFNGKRVSDAVLDAIKRTRQKGNKVFINTARAYIGMPEQIYTLPFDGFVNSYGLEIFADKKFIHRKFLSKELVQRVAEYGFKNNIRLYFEGEVLITVNIESDKGFSPKSMDEFKEMLGENKVCKFVLKQPLTDEQKKYFSDEFIFYGYEGIVKGYSKSHGIKLVADFYDIPIENTVAMGDTNPDIDMVTFAGIGVAMGNGSEELKNAAKYITKTIDEDGVAYAIDCITNGEVEKLKKIGEC